MKKKAKPAKKKVKAKKAKAPKRKRRSDSELDLSVQFRERRFRDIIPKEGLNHPLPIPGYKSTLPGAPGNWAKESPGA